MNRFQTLFLRQWLQSPHRKPLVLRGPRQSGKTWLIRNLATDQSLTLLEFNFERQPEMADLFDSNDPKTILKNIESERGTPINPQSSLLFLDEIQACPQLLAKLRWFKEDMPECAVIATGSLLEFTLQDHDFSMPVGRIHYAHLEPLSYFEFLEALGQSSLLQTIQSASPSLKINERLHQKSLELLREYLIIGGMPEVVQIWSESKDLNVCQEAQSDLLATYHDDFNKYGKAPRGLIQKVFRSIAEQLGGKFIASRVEEGVNSTKIRSILHLLSQAKVSSMVYMTAATGLPLGANCNEKFFKSLFVDVGLVSSQLGLGRMPRDTLHDMTFANKGALAEQLVGQLLRAAQSKHKNPELYYWERTGGRQGEVHFMIQIDNQIIPIEVKAGASGSMKSLHQFMYDKQLTFAVRFDDNPPSLQDISIKTTQGHPVSYRLLNLPIYMAEMLEVIVRKLQHEGDGF